MSGIDPAEKAMIDALSEKTGRGLDQWLAHLKGEGLTKHGEVMSHLKADHGVTHGYANLIAQYHGGRAERLAVGGDDLIAAQYGDAKAGLLPIYQAIADAVGAFGDDVELAAKKTYVSLRRKKQFGLIQPSTRTRVDVGINLRNQEAIGRLEASGSFNAMVSHRVRIESVDQVDDALINWLREAYVAAS